ncbi:hypothetical protein pb186bvf_009076 [Paramecium bursaria]
MKREKKGVPIDQQIQINMISFVFRKKIFIINNTLLNFTQYYISQYSKNSIQCFLI